MEQLDYGLLLQECEKEIDLLMPTVINNTINKSARAEERLTALLLSHQYLLDMCEDNEDIELSDMIEINEAGI